MRKSQHSSRKRQQEEQELERLYRTIPNRQHDMTVDLPQEVVEQIPPKHKRIVKRILISLVILLLLSGIFLGWKFAANIVKIFGWNGLKNILSTQKLDGEDQGRVTILLAGNSSDDIGHGGADLTDSIMLVSLNTVQKTGYILSIPRDLYVNISGNRYAKINETYQDGKQSGFAEPGYPEGGMGLLEKVVAEQFGVTPQYYALVNYTALQQAVDAVGGVDIVVTSTDPRGLYDSSPDLRNNRLPIVKLSNGPTTLDGKTALNLARARGNGRVTYGYAQSDFTRTEYQRKILVGLKQKAGSASTLTNPVKLSKLMDTLGNNVTTDFEVGELRRLQQLTSEIPDTSIQSVSLNNAAGKNLLQSYTTKSRQSALVPAAGIDDYTAIRAFISGL